MFEQIPFDTWFYMCRDKMTIDVVLSINPFVGGFYRFGNSFIQFQVSDGNLWVLQAVGKGNDWMSELRRNSIKAGIKKIYFITNVNNRPVNALAKYWNCELVEVLPNFYGEYSGNHWILDCEKPNYRFK